MKTQPANLLLALMLGFASMAFVSTSVLAGSSEDSKKEQEDKDKEDKEDKDKKDKEDKDAKDTKDAKDSSDSASCTSKLIKACALDVIQTTCPEGKQPTSTIKGKDGKGESDDKEHTSKDKDSVTNKNDRDRYEESRVDHKDRSNTKDGKIAICHRMGGARVSLVVANDGWLNGHSKHALDTIGRCEDFDDAKNDDSKKDSDKKISASDAGYSRGFTPSQIDCLTGPTNSTYTINGKSYPGAIPVGKASTTTITIPSSNQGSSRGGVRTLR
ncbi:MAG: hypothetical protein Q7U78_13845 [Gallionella sp.]|nr:hypothetical protein [Gallionella sp.]